MRTSPTDSREYRTVTLDNGLKALLISDPQTPKAAAALAINVGHFDDPLPREGLAHFLEHMLFLGTEKYPHAGEYQQYISHHGGSNNAWTGTEFTNFFFDIDNDWLEGALDRFSQFFISPLFTPELVDKERQAVDSEYQLKIQDDVRRLYQVHKQTINPEHPFSKFSVGSEKTLADRPDHCVRDDLLKFYHQHYSADRMTFVLISHHSLAQQQNWLSFFAPIKKRNWHARAQIPLLRDEDQGIIINVEPLKEVHRLTLSFNFENIHPQELYPNKPLEFLANLIGYEGPNSLIALLRHEGLIQNMAAGGGISGQNFREFTISYQLNEDGLNAIDTIVEATFSLIQLIAQQGLESWRYEEKRQLLKRAWHYQERSRSIDLAAHYAINLQQFAEEDVLIGDYLMEQFEPEQIQKFIQKMTPQTMRLTLVSPGVDTDAVAPWYDTPYKKIPFNHEQLKRWSNPQVMPIQLPSENPFLNLANPKNQYNDTTEVPYPLIDEKGFKLWHYQDGEFKLPKGHIYISLDSAFAVQSVKHIAQNQLAVEIILDYLAEITYQAEIAGMSYQIYPHQGGFTLHSSGFSERQFELIKLVLDSRQHGQYNAQRFKLVKQQLIHTWLNQSKIKPINQLFHQLTAILQPKSPTGAQLAAAIEDVHVEQMSEFIANIYRNIHVEAFIYGSWSKKQAQSIGQYIRRTLVEGNNPANETPRELMNLEGLQTLNYRHHCQHNDSALLMYFQSPIVSAKQTALFSLCNQLMSSIFFYELRTQQQLGYIVGNGNLPLNRHPGMLFYIQSPNSAPQSLLDAIDQFIDHFPKVLNELSEQQWIEAKHGLAGQILEKETNMRTRARRFWVSIANKDKHFNQREEVVEELMKLTREELMRFTMELKNSHRDRLILFTCGEHHHPCQNLSDAQNIGSIEQFHASVAKFSY
ncbi:insulinase family protein [Celerinatantimonas diazotrophica]|uniref:Protease 3 n=1 Tax=Celerinatantimonas diazotrophica TaxID=412034 RepID=A0A4V2PS62_9GAMM|nr:insulinase family protein [Celerinatantimonas diazotrophica]TCK61471.1 secreted Zn-dependent insulinase-like peptidase [Celerinatantimonas diazotrophica]CAG9296934.1 Protease 3 [Celerinatantimonas diazotrophica]